MRANSEAGSAGAKMRIGRYRVIAPLARGGMAEIYVVVRDGTDHPTVLKRLLLELEDHPTAAIRFKREAELSTRLQHPRIVQTLRTALEEGRPMIEMELIPGQTVEAMMLALTHHQRLPPLDCSLRVALDALEGLAYAHELRDDENRNIGLVHRDISPRNILLGLDGAARLIDFGIARADWNGYLTAPGSILGTFSHASPEQAVAGPVDRRSDLYSLGVVLYEMVTGQSLVPLGETMEMLKRVTAVKPPPARELNPSLPAALEAVLARALEKRVEDRYPDASSFAAALEAAVPTDASESRRRLAALLKQLFPENAGQFAHYQKEAKRIAGEELVVPTQLATEVSELTEQHTRVTEVQGQKSSADRTHVVRRRTNSREIDIATKVVDRDRGTVTEPRAFMASLTQPAPHHEPTAIGELRRQNRQLQKAVIALAVGLLGLAGLTLFQLRGGPETPSAAPSPPPPPAATPAPAPIPIAESPRATAAPEPETAAAPSDAPPPLEASPPPEAHAPAIERRVREEKRTVVEPAAPPAPTAAKPSPAARARAAVITLSARLRSSPNDAELFEQTARALERALGALPAEKQRSLKAKLQRAEVMNDADILGSAVEAYLNSDAP